VPDTTYVKKAVTKAALGSHCMNMNAIMVSGPPPYAPESGQPVEPEQIQMSTAPQTAGKRALVTFSIGIWRRLCSL